MDEITGYIENILFVNEENGFTVAKLKEKNKKELTCIVGTMSSISPGENITCKGEFSFHTIYGKQFIVSEYSIKLPSDVIGIQKYLESGLIKGIGPIYAKRIIEKFQEKTLDVIEKNPEKLLNVEGIGKKRIETIKICFKEQKEIRDIIIFLKSFDISPTLAQKIYKRYGNESIFKLRENPYQLSREIFGIGFKIADSIAKKMGFNKTSKKRVEAGIEYTFLELAGQGHTCFPENNLLIFSKNILEVEENLISEVLEEMIKEEKIVRSTLSNKNFIWISSLYNFEKEISKNLLKIKNYPSPLRKIDLEKAIIWVQKKLNLNLEEKQIKAVKKAFLEKIHIITGGPGTGKSTIVKAILEITKVLTKNIILAAPTGRAAKRLSQITHKKAFTIHSLLEFDFIKKCFKKNQKNPLKADLLIIDESSMIDTFLMYHLTLAISPHTKVIFVGDIDQLPSIGPGYVLKDIIESKMFSVIRLLEIFRQAKGSKIITNAHKINKGFPPDLTPSFDFRFIEIEDPQEIEKEIINLVSEKIPKKYKIDNKKQIQVLSPMKKGIIGIENLNSKLQKELNPSETPFYRGGKTFHINDKVMQIKNNYNKNVFNGDIGKIVKIDLEEEVMVISFEKREVSYNFSELDEIVLAYAISVHKYQGSECFCIVIPIHTTHFKLLQRNLLYTAITRGKRLVILIGTKKALYIAIRNNSVLKRHTGLNYHLKKVFKSLEEYNKL
jgi:exodeoxyribonuclease V alpha subunit